MAFVITLVKTIPNTSIFGSGAYSTTGANKTLSLKGVKMSWETRKNFIPLPFLQSPNSYDGTDQNPTYLIDLRNISEKLKIEVILEDDGTDTAWEKAWMLRAMEVVGGPIHQMIVGESVTKQIEFSSDSEPAFLESVSWDLNPQDQAITSSDLTIKATLEFVVAKNKAF
jgi:hypothetical protein